MRWSGRSPCPGARRVLPAPVKFPPRCHAARWIPLLLLRYSGQCGSGRHPGRSPAHRHSRYADGSRYATAGIQYSANRLPPGLRPAAGRRPSPPDPQSAPSVRAGYRYSAGARLPQTFRKCPEQCPGFRCRSMSRPSFARTSPDLLHQAR